MQAWRLLDDNRFTCNHLARPAQARAYLICTYARVAQGCASLRRKLTVEDTFFALPTVN